MTEVTSNGDVKTKDSIYASINENDDRKLFVGSLSWETKEEEFREYFAAFGEVKDASIKVDGAGRSRGFGFILFEDPSAVDKVLAEESHSLGNRKIQPKKATPKERTKKIFVGGVSPELPEEDIRTHFEQYGEIESMELPMNKEKNIRKGFCFITFKDADACDAATAKGKLKQELGDRQVDVKKAVPQEIYQGWATATGGGWYPRGGRGGFRGGPAGRGTPRGYPPFQYAPAGYYMDPYYMDPYYYPEYYGGSDVVADYPAGVGGRGRGRGRGGGRY